MRTVIVIDDALLDEIVRFPGLPQAENYRKLNSQEIAICKAINTIIVAYCIDFN